MPDRRDPMMPGGDTAVVAGCTCPVLDNGRGNVDLARDRGGWWITSDCSLHGIDGSHPAPVPPQQSSERPADTPARDAGDAESHGKGN
jgi:hypothetical protein